jgi:hypothetical protein
MKQFYITKENISQDSPDDCYLAPDDPIQELKIASYMGGLGSMHKLAEYRQKAKENVQLNTVDEFGMTGAQKAEYMKKNNIRPGTPAWFELWRGTPTKL